MNYVSYFRWWNPFSISTLKPRFLEMFDSVQSKILEYMKDYDIVPDELLNTFTDTLLKHTYVLSIFISMVGMFTIVCTFINVLLIFMSMFVSGMIGCIIISIVICIMYTCILIVPVGIIYMKNK